MYRLERRKIDKKRTGKYVLILGVILFFEGGITFFFVEDGENIATVFIWVVGFMLLVLGYDTLNPESKI